MSGAEVISFLVFVVLSIVFFKHWYKFVLGAWPTSRIKAAKCILGLLPVAIIVLYILTLRHLASFDVVNDLFWLIYYVLFGIVAIYIGIGFISRLLDLSWIDDALNQANKAALFAITGGALGLASIFAGANVGDGPGWWCVLMAGGIGFLLWFVLAVIINRLCNTSERITVERDNGTGIRLGMYFVAAGIILARASAGDWTDFWHTVIEFGAGWPVLPLAALAIGVEQYYIHKSKNALRLQTAEGGNDYLGSVFWGLVYVGAAIAIIMFVIPPLPQNDLYEAFSRLGGGLPC